MNGYQSHLVVTGSGGLTFNETRDLSIAGSSSMNVLIQTDKATYKPMDTGTWSYYAAVHLKHICNVHHLVWSGLF